MGSTHRLALDDGTEITAVELGADDRDRLATVVTGAGVETGRPVLVVVGGAGGMDADDLRRLRPVFAGVVALLEDVGGAAVDGGTDAGVMRLLGDARCEAGADFPLLGVAARGTVAVGAGPHGPDAADVGPCHSHLLLVPGASWGDEAPWIAEVATAVADGSASVTLLVNGGDIAYADARHSHDQGRRVLVVAGSGRTADVLAAALRGDPSADERARALVADGPVTSVPIDESSTIVDALAVLLTS